TGFPGWCFSAAYSGDGFKLVVGTGGGTVEVLRVSDKKVLSKATVGQAGFRTRGVRFLSDGRTIVSGGQDGPVRISDSDTGAVLRSFSSARSEIYAIDIDPREELIAVGHMDRTTKIWKLSTGELLQSIPAIEKRVEALAFSPDGETLAISALNKGI